MLVLQNLQVCLLRSIFYQIREVEHLSALDCLEHLFLKGNSLTQSSDYRIRVFSLLSKTWKQVNAYVAIVMSLIFYCVYQLTLDGVEATTEEQVRLLNH